MGSGLVAVALMEVRSSKLIASTTMEDFARERRGGRHRGHDVLPQEWLSILYAWSNSVKIMCHVVTYTEPFVLNFVDLFVTLLLNTGAFYPKNVSLRGFL